MDETPQLAMGQWVEIGGRTMLRPGFSLVGLTGIIYYNSPNAPAGCQTVAVDWPRHGYTPESGYEDGTLPLFVNIPTNHLTPIEAPEPLPAVTKEPANKTKLTIESGNKTSAGAREERDGSDLPPAGPGLRLV